MKTALDLRGKREIDRRRIIKQQKEEMKSMENDPLSVFMVVRGHTVPQSLLPSHFGERQRLTMTLILCQNSRLLIGTTLLK